MLDFLLNNSIFIIFAITASALGYFEYKQYLKRRNMDPKEFRSLLRLRLNEIGNELMVKLLVSIIVTLVISIVSFRELWMNDTFHVVLLTNIMSRHVYGYLKRLVK